MESGSQLNSDERQLISGTRTDRRDFLCQAMAPAVAANDISAALRGRRGMPLFSGSGSALKWRHPEMRTGGTELLAQGKFV
jgi:hypothetical protein